MSVDGNRKNKIDSIGGPLSVCMGCRNAITDQYILRVAPDMEWHAACLKCANCQQFLDETCTCFVRDGKTYCKRDYVRLFGAKCDKCRGGFARTDMVMRARSKIFHLNCFRCSSCEKQLLPGDEFALREDCLFCRHDYDTIKDESNDEDITDDNHNTDLTCPVQLAEEPELASQETPSRPSTGGSASGGTTNGSESDRVLTTTISGNGGTITSRRESSGRIHKTEGKPTRIRTVLTEKQLHTLRTCYNANPRPDALMKEQLVEMTALSPRVIRVWFQNKRCKDKKRAIFMKQVVLQQEKSGRYGSYGSMHGIPLVASPPSHQDLLGVPFDVTAYQAPWKSLAEFALTHDLDRIDPCNPQYQQILQQVEEVYLSRGLNSSFHLRESGHREQVNVGEKSRASNLRTVMQDRRTTIAEPSPLSPPLSPDPQTWTYDENLTIPDNDGNDADDDDYAMACEDDDEINEMSNRQNFLSKSDSCKFPHIVNNHRNVWC